MCFMSLRLILFSESVSESRTLEKLLHVQAEQLEVWTLDQTTDHSFFSCY